MLPADLHSCLTLQKHRALHLISVLDVDERDSDSDSDSKTANQIAYQQLHNLVEGTVNRGEGNSCLLLGPKGSGKTSVSPLWYCEGAGT